MSIFLVVNKIYSELFKQKRAVIKGIKWLIQSLRKIDSKIRAKFQEKCPVLYHRSGLKKQNMATAAVNQ